MTPIVIHVFLGILTAILGLTSPVPDTATHLNMFTPVNINRNDDRVGREITTSRADAVLDGNTVERKSASTIWDDWNCHDPEQMCGYRQRSAEAGSEDLSAAGETAPAANVHTEENESDVVTTPDSVILRDGLSPSNSSDAIFAHQSMDPTYEGWGEPCVKAIMANYGGRNLRAVSLTGAEALYEEVRNCLHGPTGSGNETSARESTYDNDPFRNEECAKKVTQISSGDLPPENERDAFMLTVMGCMNKSVTPATNSTSMFDTRDYCPIPRNSIYAWVYIRVVFFVLDKKLDESRWPSGLLVDILLPCVTGVIDHYEQLCVANPGLEMLDARIDHCWFTTFYYGGPGCNMDNECKSCGRDRPAHICP